MQGTARKQLTWVKRIFQSVDVMEPEKPSPPKWLELPSLSEKHCKLCANDSMYTFVLASGRYPLCRECIKDGHKTCVTLWG
jgi:hypothetical protein